jgi:hypothetical protein
LTAARELLGDSIAKLLVTSATDVHSICNLGRSVPKGLYEALLERDPCCVVPGCSASYNLEIDHRVVPFAQGGPTQLANLARICHHHHCLKTYEGYALEGEPGAWIWRHPDGSCDGPGAPPAREPSPPPPTDPIGDEGTDDQSSPAQRPGLPPVTQQPSGLEEPFGPEQASLFTGLAVYDDRVAGSSGTYPEHAA